MEWKAVETGFSNGSEIEITSGLSEGDAVYIASTVSAGQSEESLRQSGASLTQEPAGDMTGEEENGQQGFPDFMQVPGENPQGNSGQAGGTGFGGPGMP